MEPGLEGGVSAQGSGSLKLSDVAYARIAASIASGEYAVGSKLPTENELADLLKVSRPIVREALSRLRDDGLVVSRRGSGTYVRRAPMPDDRRLAPLSSIADMRRCLDFRLSYETETAYRAAQALTPEGEQRIREALARLEQGLAAGEIDIESDYNFHMAVARATENRFFAAGLAAMRDPITAGMNITRHFALLRTRDRLLALHEEHVRIAQAIYARDADGARQAMRTHLENAIARAFDGTAT
jgi:DNA-binding FadR family transcriptional regulator